MICTLTVLPCPRLQQQHKSTHMPESTQRPAESSQSLFHCCRLLTAPKQGSPSNDCTRAAVTAPSCWTHGPAELQSLSLHLHSHPGDKRWAGCSALLPSPPLQPQVHQAQPCVVRERHRLGLNICLIDRCLQLHFFLFHKNLLQLALGHFKCHL